MRVFIHTCVQDAHGARREYQILLEMGFHVVVSCLMCDESHTRVLCQSRIHSPAPQCVLLNMRLNCRVSFASFS